MEEVTINPTIELPELTETGETDSWRAQTKPCVHKDSGERSSDPKETVPDLPMSVQESLAEAWVSRGLLQDWGQSSSMHAWDLLKEVSIIFITSTIVWTEVKKKKKKTTQGGNTAPPTKRKLG